MGPDTSTVPTNITREGSYDDLMGNNKSKGVLVEATGEYFIPPPPKPNPLEQLNASLAPYLAPGSNKESAFFKSISRADIDRI